jgi:SAM-dependent methyltransferase
MMKQTETDDVRMRYERRKSSVESNRYSPLKVEVWQGIHERQRVMLRLFARLGLTTFADTKLVEVGCGAGGNLLEFLQFGFQRENLFGIELLEDRVAKANKVLPAGMVRTGDATSADIPCGSQDVVFQSTVFSSLLDDAFQEELANKMWSWVRPGEGKGQRAGGGILWYDFIFNNPRNPDVRGVTVKRIRELFPQGKMTVKRITLAPPLARRVCPIHPGLYSVFNAMPFLRTHVLCWIQK